MVKSSPISIFGTVNISNKSIPWPLKHGQAK